MLAGQVVAETTALGLLLVPAGLKVNLSNTANSQTAIIKCELSRYSSKSFGQGSTAIPCSREGKPICCRSIFSSILGGALFYLEVVLLFCCVVSFASLQVIRFVPPLIVTEAEVSTALAILDQALAKVIHVT